MWHDLLSFLLGQKAADLREIHRIQLRNEMGLPTWTLLLLSAALMVLSFYLYQRQNVTSTRKKILAFLRGTGFIVLLLILTRPYIFIEGILEVKGQLLVILDGTLSMTIQDVESQGQTISRYDAGKVVMKDLMAKNDTLSKHFYPSYYVLRESLEKVSHERPAEIDEKKPAGNQTSLVNATNNAMRDHKGEPVSAVLFLTDGGHNTGEFFDNMLEDLKADHIPFMSMGLGKPEAKDVALTHIFSEDVVFIDETAPFLLKIQQTGYGGQDIAIHLLMDGQEVAMKKHTLEAVREQTVTFPYVPKKTGKHKFTFQITRLPEEMVAQNNELEKFVDVIDSQVRILLYYASPDWEYRYIKGALQRDKRVKLTLLMDELDRRILESNPPDYLKTFPADRKDFIDKYDLVILGQVHSSTFSTRQLEMLRDFVGEEGGSIVFIADPTAIPGSYMGSPLEALFPIKFRATKGRGLKDELTSPLREDVGLKLSEEGLQHPLVRLEEDPKQNQRVWSSFLPHYWGYTGQGLKPSALALVTERAGGAKAEPLIVHQQFGKGSVLFMGINDTWRWRYQVGDTYFRRYWGKVVQFMGLPHLTGSSGQVTITTDKRSYFTGEKVNITARVLNPDFSPSTATKESLKIETGGTNESQTIELTPVHGHLGMFKGVYLARREGEFTLAHTGESASNGKGLTFTVRELQQEFRFPEMNQKLLQESAAATGGQALPYGSAEDVLKALGEARKTMSTSFEKSLWDTWAAILLFVFIFAAEWFFRKRWHLD